MLLINGINAIIGMALAMLLYAINQNFGLHGYWLIGLATVMMWFYLFITDVVEDKLIEHFNEEVNDVDGP